MMQFQRKHLLWDALLTGSSLAALIAAAFLAFFGGEWYAAASNAARRTAKHVPSSSRVSSVSG